MCAGLPPVTAEWFEARKEQLSVALTQANNAADSLYICSLTNKKFQSEGTYETYTRTNKFKTALKKAGLKETPAPRVVQRQGRPQAPPAAPHMTQIQQGMAGLAVRDDRLQVAQLADSEFSEEDEEEEGASSGWETASQIDDDTLAAARSPRSLFGLRDRFDPRVCIYGTGILSRYINKHSVRLTPFRMLTCTTSENVQL